MTDKFSNLPHFFLNRKENAKSFSSEKCRAFFCRFGSFLFFWASFFYLETLLCLTNASASFGGLRLVRCIFSCLAFAALLWIICTWVPQKTVSRIIADVFLFFCGAYAIAQCCILDFFGSYFQLTFMFQMTGQVAGNFLGDAIGVVVKHLWFFPLALLPGALQVIFRKKLIPSNKVNGTEDSGQDRETPTPLKADGTPSPEGDDLSEDSEKSKNISGLTKPEKKILIRLLITGVIILILAQGLNILFCRLGDDNQYYTYDFSANSAIPRFGFVNSLRLEIRYGIFGQPELEFEEEATLNTQEAETTEETAAETEAETEEEIIEVVYDYNILDIDFDTLIAEDTDSTLLAMDQYFSSQSPTQQNEYTGLFEGKNLIFITAEAFSYAVIDEELTPALYMLANSGFVFSNYYQPSWNQSTTGGEFAAMTGIIPTWVNGNTAFAASSTNLMPFGMGWLFNALGYNSTAWHNNSYTYYSRNLTHPNLGYTFTGIGNGLEIESSSLWPSSDLEMVQATIDDQIEAYVNDGTLFNCYYMSVSGHCNYGWDANDMSKKNQEAVSGLEYSETVLAYIAAQLELEYALEYILEALEEAGIMEDTVIVLTADHYPYALAETSTDYYIELTGIEDNEYMTSRYKNTLILWSGSMEEPIEVDTPCTAVDILPTLLNLFGIDYDSRLLSGRDILAEDVAVGEVDSSMHIALFSDYGYGYSWITNAGTYESYTGTFTAAQGVELEDEDAYVEAVSSIVKNRFTYANYIIKTDYYSHIFPNWQADLTLPQILSSEED